MNYHTCQPKWSHGRPVICLLRTSQHQNSFLKVKTDILKSIDNQEITYLILMDLSVAFDMVNHEILIKYLHDRFWIRNRALQWVESYLRNRSQKVAIGDLGTHLGMTSKVVTLTFGIPQGSVLGPFCFHYTRHLWDISTRNMEWPITFMLMTNRFIFHSNLWRKNLKRNASQDY